MIDENGQHYIIKSNGYISYSAPITEANCVELEAVTEVVYKAHHWCLAHGISVPDGYEVVGFNRNIGPDEFGLLTGGMASGGAIHYHHHAGPIIKKKEEEIEWVTPTDEDARHRPEVEVSNVDGGYKAWGKIRTLYGVSPCGTFIGRYGDTWKYCRMNANQRKEYK